ncbi:hypothetical protein [Methylomonas sp. DH-1]|uniref:hypothetical protein n=1 Tax=Methylomonas sp. (strain DH-1) TaxID=1727196 RepID=UPI0007C8EB8F|nr:hypothetical protein [Methylomonas sp. DH-1]ANE56672.1 hypothetical protein AYM39_16800 [Methylomonas sp. DH-1]
MKYPLLRLNKFHIRKFQSENELKLMSQKYFDEGNFKVDTFFIDSSGFRYALIDVRKERNSLNPFRWFRSSPAIVVDIIVSQPVQLSLDNMKKTIFELVVKNEWHRQGYQNESEFHDMIYAAKSYREIIDMISFYGKWQG